LGINYLASIADVSSTLKKSETSKVPYLYLAEKPLSVFAEGFRNMRAAMLYSPNKIPKVIAVTSALPGEGKTTTSVCLATAFSLAGNSVVVVDCDLRKRSLNAIFKQSPEKGLVEAVMGEVTLAQVILQDEATKVHYVPLSVHPVTSQDIFSNPKFDAVLASLREQFDYVILDTAPILPVADTRILARKADYVALLIRWRKTPKRAVQAAVDILEGARVEINGAALTQVDVAAQGKYGYGDAGYYYKDYKSYYVQN
jgi:capsular exopolysaccharide synthesis family protein